MSSPSRLCRDGSRAKAAPSRPSLIMSSFSARSYVKWAGSSVVPSSALVRRSHSILISSTFRV